MKKLALIIFQIWLGSVAGAQQILWEKKIGGSLFNQEIYKISESIDGNFWAIGADFEYSYLIDNGSFPETFLLKIKPNGDTIFSKRLFQPLGACIFIGHKFGNIHTMVLSVPLVGSVGFNNYPCIIDFDLNGNVITKTNLTDLAKYSARSALRTNDQGLLLSGSFEGGLSLPTKPMAIKINFLNQVEWFHQYDSPITNVAARSQRIERQPNGRYMMSGTMGKRIIGLEIDSLGFQVGGPRLFYETPSNKVLFEGEAQQSFYNSQMVTGYYLDDSSNTVGILARMQNNSQKIWGGETKKTSVHSLIQNRENSMLVGRTGFVNSIERITRDSISLWKLILSIDGPDEIVKYVKGLCFTKPDTGIVYGYFANYFNDEGQQYYFAKVAGVGTPYNPANPSDTTMVSTQPNHIQPPNLPVAYPNPVVDQLSFKNLDAEAELSIYSLRGEKLKSINLPAKGSASLCGLAAGVYLYHLQTEERVYTGKIMKR